MRAPESLDEHERTCGPRECSAVSIVCAQQHEREQIEEQQQSAPPVERPAEKRVDAEERLRGGRVDRPDPGVVDLRMPRLAETTCKALALRPGVV